MNIDELRVGAGSVNIEADVIEMSPIREFNKYGRMLKVANAVLQDATGTVKLSLWNDDAEKVQKGDRIKITNGYVNEYQGEKQLTPGKFGKLEVTGKAEGGAIADPSSAKKEDKIEYKEEAIDDSLEAGSSEEMDSSGEAY